MKYNPTAPKVRPRVMGVLNTTPDSFSDGNQFLALQAALDHAKLLQMSGADIIDVGGESTRPGAIRISVEEEQERVLPVIAKIVDSELGWVGEGPWSVYGPNEVLLGVYEPTASQTGLGLTLAKPTVVIAFSG